MVQPGEKSLIHRTLHHDKWYLVDTINHKEPRLVRVDFNCKEDVIYIIKEKLNNNIRWDYIKGSEAFQQKIKFKRKGRNTDGVLIGKYRYFPEHLTRQERKSFRTKFRRHEKTNKKGEQYNP